MSTDIPTLSLHSGDEYIELYKVLKAQGMISAGGEAKHAISEGKVLVNGEVETRVRKKMHSGDTVQLDDNTGKVE